MERCELALSGFIVWDLWQIVASSTEKELGVKAGKLSLAGQTRRNLQQVALNVVLLASFKPADWNPWSNPHRLSEIGIEHYFGQIRCQYASGDVNARGYFNAATRIAQRQASCNKSSPLHTDQHEEPLTADQSLA